MVRYGGGSTAEKLHNGIMAQMKPISAMEIHDSCQGNDSPYLGLVGRQAEGELASGRVPDDYDPRRVKIVLFGVLD